MSLHSLNPELRRTVIGTIGGGLVGLIGGAYAGNEFATLFPDAPTWANYLEIGAGATLGTVTGAYAGMLTAHADSVVKILYHKIRGK